MVEIVIGELGTPDFATMIDMNMPSVAQGMERELAEYDALFTAAGWRRQETRPIGAGYSMMEITVS